MDRKSDFSGFVKMTEVGKVYSEFKDFLTTVQWRYSEKSHDFLCKVRTYEGDRTKYKNDCTERVKQWCLKALWQPGIFSEKDVLDYLLSYMCIRGAEYGKERDVSYYNGYVKIPFPTVEELNCSGNTIFRSYKISSAVGSEEAAAAKALKFIEGTFNMEIVDFNPSERVDAEIHHSFIVDFLKKLIVLGDDVKSQWADMIASINSGHEVYSGGHEKFSGRPLSSEEVNALEFCTNGLLSVQSHCVSSFECAAAKIDKLHDFYPEDDEAI